LPGPARCPFPFFLHTGARARKPGAVRGPAEMERVLLLVPQGGRIIPDMAMRKTVFLLITAFLVACISSASGRTAIAGRIIYLTPEKFVYPFPLDEEIQIMGYLRELTAGVPVDIEVSLELPGGSRTYLDPTLEFHPQRTRVFTGFPFVAVPTAELFSTDGSKIFQPGAASTDTAALGDDVALGDMPAGRYLLRATLSGGGARDTSEAVFFLVAEEMLPAIAETPRPIIDGLDPPYGEPGSAVTIRGRNLRGDPDLVDPGLIDRFQIKVTLAGQELPVLDMDEKGEWLQAQLLAGATSGAFLVQVTLPYWDELDQDHLSIPRVAVFSSNAFPFFVQPRITALSTAGVFSGQYLEITGRNFNPDPVANQVLFDAVPGEVTLASETSLTVRVPELETAGPVVLTVVSNGICSAPMRLLVASPAIASWYPRTLVPGSTLTITGTGFSYTQEDNEVYLGDIALPVLTSTENKITVQTGTSLMPGVLPLRVVVNGASSRETAMVVVVPVWR